MRKSEKIEEGLYRVKIPFEDLFTTVYIVSTPDGVALIDSATYPSDAENYVIPALAEIGECAERVKYILLSHDHGDHAGGAPTLAELIPCARVRSFANIPIDRCTPLTDGELICGVLRAVLLPGHTTTSCGFVDERSKTLLSADCLQLFGVGKYRDGIAYPDRYRKSVEKLRGMDIKRIVAAHDYDPLGSVAEGCEQVNQYLDICLDAVYNKNEK